MARRTKAAALRACRSSSRASRQQRLIQANLLSTSIASGAPRSGPVTAANDLTLPDAGPGDNRFHCATLIARIGDDARDQGKAPSGLPPQRLRPVPVLNRGWGNDDRPQQAERVGQDGALAARHRLARIEA